MEGSKSKNILYKFLGLTLFVQAVTSLVGGSIFMGPFDSKEIRAETLINIANNTTTAYISILLQVITGIVIIMLGVAMYRAAGHMNKTMASLALSLYVLESAMLVVSQIFVFALLEVSQLYIIGRETSLIALGNVLVSCRSFAGEMAMIPFGIGAFLFYYLLLKADILPKWLGLWGLISVPLILFFVPLTTFGVDIPFFLLLPYVPFEFFTGIFILVKYRNKKIADV